MLYDTAKRLIDIGSAVSVGLVFLPLIFLISLAIKLDSPGSIFYRSSRVGKGGKPFSMLKFRSMISDADKFLLKHPEYMKKFKTKEGWKMGEAEDDPRITRVGRFIRQFSFDELPQLWNILVGDMSIVGPRPYRNDAIGNEIEEQLKNYPHLRKELQLALSVRPGLSGPWQTTGRNELSWDQRVKLDADYARKRSLLGDIVIIVKTPFAMFNKW